MKICISQITTLPADTQSDLKAFSNAGWRAVELALGKVEKYLSEHSWQTLKEEMDQQGLQPVGAIGLASSDPALLLSRGTDFKAYIETLERQMDICQKLGIRLLGIGADHRSHEYDGWQGNALENLSVAGDLAEQYGLSLSLEYMSLNPPVGPFVLDRMDDTLQLVREVNHKNIGYNLDLFHYYRSGDTIEGIRALDVEKLLHVHWCDLPQMELDPMDDSHRLLPGQGILPLMEIAEILRGKGYDGYLSLELLNEDLYKSGPDVTAVRSLEAMKQFASGGEGH